VLVKQQPACYPHHMYDQERELRRAELAAKLSYENLARLGKSCAKAHERHADLVRERDVAIVGVARWGYSHRALANAASVTQQRVTQILAEAQRKNPGEVPAGLASHGIRRGAKLPPG
jgi:hypothetical protein